VNEFYIFSNLSHISTILNEKKFNIGSIISPRGIYSVYNIGDNDDNNNNFVYNIIKRNDDEVKKKPKVLNKAFIMEDMTTIDRINKLNEKVNSMRNHTELNNIR
jgi:hypothetical protein